MTPITKLYYMILMYYSLNHFRSFTPKYKNNIMKQLFEQDRFFFIQNIITPNIRYFLKIDKFLINSIE